MANPYKKASLSCQTTKHFVVIRKNKAYPLDVLKNFLNDHYSQWALITHKNHKDPNSGEIIPIHYHYIGNYKKKRTPLSTALNQLAKALKSDKNGLEIDQYQHIEGAIQYLTHKNNPEKTQMEFKDIIFNGWSKDELLTYYTTDDNSINFDRVLAVCKNYDSIIDVIREIGFSSYHKYRNTIRDIFTELHEEKSLKDKVARYVHEELRCK